MSPPPLRQRRRNVLPFASPFLLSPKSRALVLLYRRFPRSLALALALSLALSRSFSLFALSFKRGGYQSLLSTQETLYVDDRRCEEVLFCYAKEGAASHLHQRKNKHQNAKCQMPKGSKQKKTKKRNRNNTKQNKNKNSPIPRGARNETNER